MKSVLVDESECAGKGQLRSHTSVVGGGLCGSIVLIMNHDVELKIYLYISYFCCSTKFKLSAHKTSHLVHSLGKHKLLTVPYHHKYTEKKVLPCEGKGEHRAPFPW